MSFSLTCQSHNQCLLMNSLDRCWLQSVWALSLKAILSNKTARYKIYCLSDEVLEKNVVNHAHPKVCLDTIVQVMMHIFDILKFYLLSGQKTTPFKRNYLIISCKKQLFFCLFADWICNSSNLGLINATGSLKLDPTWSTSNEPSELYIKPI